MILFLTKRRYSFTVARYLAAFPELARHMAVLPYEALFRRRKLPVAGYVFGDLERLSRQEQGLAARIHAALAAAGDPDIRLFNHPAASLRRYGLLRRLHELGLNDFDLYRLDEDRWPRRYPVFIRHEHDHGGALTPLLDSRTALEAAIRRLDEAGQGRAGLIAVEFAGGIEERGLHRRYTVLMANGKVLRRRLSFSRNWVVKRHDVLDDWTAAEERRFIEENPHEAHLAAVFRIAGIDYGRADYGCVGGRVQVYEINTNPNLLTRSELRLARDPPRVTRNAEHLGPLGPRLLAALEDGVRQADGRGSVPIPAAGALEYAQLLLDPGYLPAPLFALLKLGWRVRRRLTGGGAA